MNLRRRFSSSSISLQVAAVAIAITTPAQADGVAIGKVYDPYVQLLEREFEYRGLFMHDDENAFDGDQQHRIGYGQALAERWFGEAYVLGTRTDGNELDIDAFELELKRQLTEQGEYSSDWGLLFELERSTELNIWELANTLIVAHDWGRWTGTANLSLIYETGDDIGAEWETQLKAQLKYRRAAELEPALELYMGENTRGIGPLLTGIWRIGNGDKLLWESGVIFGVDSVTPDINLKLNLEYEF